MKTATGFGMLFMMMGLMASGDLSEVSIGDLRQSVVEKAGEPTGTMAAGQTTILIYPEGRVLMDGARVKGVELRPESEVETEAMRLERLAKGEAERRRRDQSRIERGKMVKQQKLADAGFLTLPAETRLTYWMQFSRLYPEVDVVSLIMAAQNELKKEEKWAEFRSGSNYSGQRSDGNQRVYRVPGYYSYGGRVHNHRPVHLPVKQEERDSGIILFENSTLFTPDLPTLPGGAVR